MLHGTTVHARLAGACGQLVPGAVPLRLSAWGYERRWLVVAAARYRSRRLVVSCSALVARCQRFRYRGNSVTRLLCRGLFGRRPERKRLLAKSWGFQHDKSAALFVTVPFNGYMLTYCVVMTEGFTQQQQPGRNWPLGSRSRRAASQASLWACSQHDGLQFSASTPLVVVFPGSWRNTG